MALKKSITTEHGFNVPESYWVIVALDYQKDVMATISVAAYANSVAKSEGATPFKMLFFSFVPNINDQQNLVTQAYNYLKSINEFSDSIDV